MSKNDKIYCIIFIIIFFLSSISVYKQWIRTRCTGIKCVQNMFSVLVKCKNVSLPLMCWCQVMCCALGKMSSTPLCPASILGNVCNGGFPKFPLYIWRCLRTNVACPGVGVADALCKGIMSDYFVSWRRRRRTCLGQKLCQAVVCPGAGMKYVLRQIIMSGCLVSWWNSKRHWVYEPHCSPVCVCVCVLAEV